MKILKDIKKEFSDFMDGDRMIMLTRPGKEGGKGNNPDRVAKKYTSRNKEEFLEIVEKLLLEMEEGLRIYSCVNKRNVNKAIRLFKQRQLEADYYDIESHQSFYFDVKNRWISCFMSPKSADETLFQFDCDDVGEYKKIKQAIEKENINIVLDYPTKSGRHIITKPFNPQLVNQHLKKGQLNKDGMLLLAW